MNTLVTAAGFNRQLEVSFNLSQSVLKPNTAEQVALITVEPGQQLQLRWLSVHLVKMNLDPFVLPTKVNPSLGTTYAGLVGDRASFLSAPAGRPLVYVPVELPGVAANPPAFITELSPGTYGLIVVNNLLATELEVSCCGAFRVVLAA